MNVSLVGHRSEFRTSFKFCRDNADLLNLLNRRNWRAFPPAGEAHIQASCRYTTASGGTVSRNE